MTPAEIAAARALVAAAPTWIETENVGRPYVPDYAPTHESTDAYIGMLNAMPKLLDEVERLTGEVETLRAWKAIARSNHDRACRLRAALETACGIAKEWIGDFSDDENQDAHEAIDDLLETP